MIKTFHLILYCRGLFFKIIGILDFGGVLCDWLGCYLSSSCFLSFTLQKDHIFFEILKFSNVDELMGKKPKL